MDTQFTTPAGASSPLLTSEGLEGRLDTGTSEASAAGSVTSVLVSSAAGMTAALLALKLVGLENARRDVKELLRWARVAPEFVWDALEWLSDTVEGVIHATPVRTLPSRP